MTAEALVAQLRARGVHLRAVGDKIRFRPVSALTPEDLEALKRQKAEVLALLAREPYHPLTLDPVTVREVLGPQPDPHDVASVVFDVMAAVAKLEAGIRTGQVPPRQLIRGRPLADWLELGEVARLLRGGQAQ